MFISIIKRLIATVRVWLRLEVCGICGLHLSTNFAVLCYRVSDNPELQEMNVCEKCMATIEAAHEKSRKIIAENKKALKK